MHVGHLEFTSPEWQAGVQAVVEGVRSGAIRVPIEGVFALEEFQAMYDALASRKTAGKLVLRIQGMPDQA